MELTRVLSYTFPLVRGEDVRAVQQALIAMRIEPPCGVADGVYGPATADAVRAFQRSRQLQLDGIVGPATWAALFRGAGAAPSPLVQAVRRELPEGRIGSTAQPPPLNEARARRVKAWLVQNFGPQIEAAIAGKPYDLDLVCAIACKETAIWWLSWIDRMTPGDVLARCVFDASGDDPSSPRSAFPRNTTEFTSRYGDGFARDLIEEANRTRRLRNLPAASMVYKGYGIFQYDLQHIVQDEAFFRGKLWCDMAGCLDRLVLELDRKVAAATDLRDAARRYNGSGPRAEEYADHVMLMRSWLT